jgi:aspartyl-tRNA(Asn)/glutamyl-tRNA(Gln) amidotransferase subunit A
LHLGLQVIGRAFDEETLFSVAEVIEQSMPKTAPPEKWWT